VPKLTLVPSKPPGPAEAVRLRVKKAPKPAAMLQCNRCGGREVLELKTGVMLEDGKPKGGTKQLVCATCYMKGDRVVLA
jgi:hypothetical protein